MHDIAQTDYRTQELYLAKFSMITYFYKYHVCLDSDPPFVNTHLAIRRFLTHQIIQSYTICIFKLYTQHYSYS